ncbi:hypothetical protein [Clostridium thermobutyricum]|uniref:Uncharacterized protein n=1 Tax=Clostridium thermobutyricum DSM 4928 TaxID=1121339 RepID=A0A1V4T108_9CLOT|nr:hypothetical protein [Clostridium thermobutyricum]OPX50907.1 hypothetical protein CLTHE_02080 [Clostridium thermobutyricum DSM 4928]
MREYRRNKKSILKKILMEKVPVDTKGRVMTTVDDEWRQESEWDTFFYELKPKR